MIINYGMIRCCHLTHLTKRLSNEEKSAFQGKPTITGWMVLRKDKEIDILFSQRIWSIFKLKTHPIENFWVTLMIFRAWLKFTNFEVLWVKDTQDKCLRNGTVISVNLIIRLWLFNFGHLLTYNNMLLLRKIGLKLRAVGIHQLATQKYKEGESAVKGYFIKNENLHF